MAPTRDETLCFLFLAYCFKLLLIFFRQDLFMIPSILRDEANSRPISQLCIDQIGDII